MHCTLQQTLTLFFMLSLYQVVSQVLNIVRDQPILHYSSAMPSLSCCDLIFRHNMSGVSNSYFFEFDQSVATDIQHCVDSSLSLKSASDMKNLAIVGYYTNSILGYAAYSALANTIYAQYHGYHIRHLSATDGAEYFPSDQRWNKVKILLDAFDPVNGWAKDFQYLVWLDSDLIILDLGLDIISVAEKYRDSDIILSADKDISVGIANTGFVIVRNTPWMLEFLKKWWNNYDKATAMDQYAFTKLYQEEKMYCPLQPVEGMAADSDLTDFSTHHIAILRSDALNSNFPSWMRQMDYNQVLHLAGANKEMRMRAFQTGVANICNNINVRTDQTAESSQTLKRVPHQLGLYRSALAAMDASLPRARILNNTLAKIRSTLDISADLLPPTIAQDVVKLTQELNEDWTMHTHVHEISGGLDPNHHELLLSGYKMLYLLMEKVITQSFDSLKRVTAIQGLLNGLFIMCGEMVEEEDQETLLELLLGTQKYIDELSVYSRERSLHSEEARQSLWNYEYMFYNRLSEYYLASGDVGQELQYRTRAVRVWWEIFEAGQHNKFGPNPHDLLADPHGNVAIMLDRYALLACRGGGEQVEDAIRAVNRSILFHEEVWGPREYHPSSVTTNHIDRLYTKSYCLQQQIDESKPANGDVKQILSLALECLHEALALSKQLSEMRGEDFESILTSAMQAVEQKIKISDKSHKKSGRFWRKGKH